MDQFALFAGSAAAAIFMISQLPMLIKAGRTKDLASYSFANIALANLGNVLYALYVFQLPVGPIWFMHTFSMAVTGLMLFWYLRYSPRLHGVGSRGAGQRDLRGPELLESDGDRSAARASPARVEQREPALSGVG